MQTSLCVSKPLSLPQVSIDMEHTVQASWKPGLWTFRLCLEENPTSQLYQGQQTLSDRKYICHRPADPYFSGDPWRPGSQRESPGHVPQF